MKAYHVTTVDGECSTIVFADDLKEAKKVAVFTDCCEDARYIDIRVHREPEADSIYKGKNEIDWYDMNTRRYLMEHLNWACIETSWECDTCPCKDVCHWWEEG